MYEQLGAQQSLRQGDILVGIPFCIDANLRATDLLLSDGSRVAPHDLASGIPQNPHLFVLTPEYSVALLLNQDCDIPKSRYLTFARVRPLTELPGFQMWRKQFADGHERASPGDGDVARWKLDHFTALGQYNALYYLAPSTDAELEASVADLLALQAVHAKHQGSMEYLLSRRVLSLTDEARAHLQARVATFFGRYAVDRNHILTAEEREALGV